MRSFDDYDDDNHEEEWTHKEPMIKFTDLEDEDGSDREVKEEKKSFVYIRNDAAYPLLCLST